jgi:hypothetical protein
MHRRVRRTLHPIARIQTRPHSNAKPPPSRLRIEYTCAKPPRSSQVLREVRVQSCTTPFHYTLRRAHRTQASASAPLSLRAQLAESISALTISCSSPYHGTHPEHFHSRPTHPPPSRARTCTPASPPANGPLAISAPGYSRRTQPVAPAPRTGTCAAHKNTRQDREQRAPAHSPPLHPHLHPTAPWWQDLPQCKYRVSAYWELNRCVKAKGKESRNAWRKRD